MNLASCIDHTILKPNCTIEEIKLLCDEAETHGFKTVCVPPYYVEDASKFLKNSPTKISTVVGFPMGYSAIPAKVEEIKRAINDGVDEVDVVVNISAIKKGDWGHVKNDIDSVTRAAHMKGKVIKLIFETNLLNQEEIKQLCVIASEQGVDFVKTSTGLHGSGATVETVQLLKDCLPSKIKIMAFGDINTAHEANKMIESGASRIGCSTGIAIVSLA